MTHPRAGDHRGARKRPRWVGPLALVVGVGIGATAAVVIPKALRDDASSGADVQASGQDTTCGEQRFSIAADPRVAATVRQVVNQMPADKCISVGVRSVPSARTAADVARAEGKGLGGALPDAWVPDSSVWLGVASTSAEGKERLDGAGTSLATSPVVLATARNHAAAIGWPDAPDWTKVLEPNPPVTLAVPRLDSDAAGLAAVAALQGSRSLTEFSRLVAAPPLPNGQPLSLVTSGTAEMVPSTEQEVATAKSSDVVAVYDQDFHALDFPLVRVRPLGAEKDAAADSLFTRIQDALTGDTGQQALGAAGFRTPDGNAASDAPQTDSVDYTTAAGDAAADTAAIDQTRADWATQGRRARLLLLMDQSGSMAARLPDGQTRAQAAQQALRGLVAGASPDDALGLWGFTTAIGNGDYQVLLPTRALDQESGGTTLRSQFLGQVDRLDPVTGGATPLYDTVAAAYASASNDYADGRFNAVVVVTDGRNEDRNSRSLSQLLDEVRRKFDGARPIRIITIAYGQEAGAATLRRIADATGGRSYRALTAEQMQQRLGELLSEL